MFTLQEQYSSGLGLVVAQTTRFDPSRMKERFGHWLNVVVDEMANQAREEISKGFKVQENPIERKVLFRRAMRDMTPIGSSNQGITWTQNTFKTPNEAMKYVKMLGTGALTYVLPWVGAIVAISSMFGGKKKMGMPWGTIFVNAVPYARQMVEQEEYARIMAEGVRVQEEKKVEIKRQSEQATQFKLPEGVTSITKGGVLMIQPKGGPVEVRK